MQDVEIQTQSSEVVKAVDDFSAWKACIRKQPGSISWSCSNSWTSVESEESILATSDASQSTSGPELYENGI